MKAQDVLKQMGYNVSNTYDDSHLQWCSIIELMVKYSNEKNKELVDALDGIQDILSNHYGDDPDETLLIKKALDAFRNTQQ